MLAAAALVADGNMSRGTQTLLPLLVLANTIPPPRSPAQEADT